MLSFVGIRDDDCIGRGILCPRSASALPTQNTGYFVSHPCIQSIHTHTHIVMWPEHHYVPFVPVSYCVRWCVYMYMYEIGTRVAKRSPRSTNAQYGTLLNSVDEFSLCVLFVRRAEAPSWIFSCLVTRLVESLPVTECGSQFVRALAFSLHCEC